MKSNQSIVEKYVNYHAALNRRWSMWWDSTFMQYSAMTAMTSDKGPEATADSIMETAEQIKKRSGWFGELNSTIRFIIAALIDQNGDTADNYMDELERARNLFRQLKVRRGGMYEIVAISILRLCGGKEKSFQPIAETQIERFMAIQNEMSTHQWWLTSVDDYPASAILTLQSASPVEIGSQTEAIYQALVSNGFWKGNPLQTASHLLYLIDDHPAAIASRFHEMAEALRARKIRVWQGEYDEVAVLTFTEGPADSVVDRVQTIQNELREIKPRVPRHVAFNLACSLAFMESLQSRESKTVTNAKAMIDLNAVIAAQQAAIMASCIAATTAATAASSSG